MKMIGINCSPESTSFFSLHSRPGWFLIVAYLLLCFPIVVKSRQSFVGYYGLKSVCSFSGSFCFPSTLLGFVAEEDEASKIAAFEMIDGEIVYCSLRNSPKIPLLQGFGNRSDVDKVDFCESSLLSDFWEQSSDLDEHLDISPSLSTGIDISPSILDWGTKNIYSPSLEMLEVVNKHNESVLNVFDLFSTNTQFNAYSFQTLSLSPGESASIPLVFLPKWLGLSSAQLVLQTSFGGFVIHAKGVATMSPYHLQPLVGFNISTGKALRGNLSLYNPYNDVLYVKEVTTWISISGSKKTNSARVLCSANRFQQYDNQSAYSTDSEWFSLRSGELGSSRVDIRPHQQWEVPPNSSRAIIELNLWPHLGRKVSGAICMKLGNSSHEISETAILPIDIEVGGKESYADLSGSVSVFFDIPIPCHERKTVFSISLRNDASYLLHVVKISEETKACNIFEIRYMEGLLLFPGTVTQIALVTYSHTLNSQDGVIENHSSGLNCMLSIRTNDSANLEMSIPCHDLVINSCKYQHGFHTFESEDSFIKLISKHKDEKCASTMTETIGNVDEESSQFKPMSSEVIEYDDLILKNWKSQATMNMMSVLDDQELLFPVVQIGSHYSKWISVHNPSQKPVVMQLILNSGTIIDHCKSTDEPSEHTFLTKFSHFDSAETRVGFSIAESAVTEAFVQPLGRALFGPVIFRPSNRCMWRTSALIRNNLSGVEWLPLQAFGGSQSLVILEGSLPILKLDFDLHFPMTFNASASDTLLPLEKSSFCTNIFSKELSAINNGELPLEVIKLKVSGTDCGSNGFTIHNCQGFSLAPGESTNLLISYQADFSTSVIRRDFELAMDAGILVIPMEASISVYMLNMCRKSLVRSMHWKIFLVVLFASLFVLHAVFRIIPQAFSPSNDDYFFTFTNTVGSPRKTEASSHLQRNNRNSRSSRDDAKNEATNCLNRYLDCAATDHRDTARKNGSFSPEPGNSHNIEPTNNTHTLEMPQNCNLTVRVVREKVRRRKRKPNGSGLAAKFEVSSSQSGNSTPSSPLSPSIPTPKHSLHLCSEESNDHSNSKRHGFEVSNLARKAESAKFPDTKWSPSVATNFTTKPGLSPSATFPAPGWRPLASTSPIAPCARAPGSKPSKLCKEKTLNGDQRDFTYDIWGNHFSERMFCRPMERRSMLSDASEGDSHSFFTRNPPSVPNDEATATVYFSKS